MNVLTQFFHQLLSPRYFFNFSSKMLPWFSVVAIVLFSYGLIGGLFLAPPDYQQGDCFRIMYVHVPSAFMSLAIYVLLAASAVVAFIWKVKLGNIVLRVAAPVGAWFTVLALVTGSIWGKPMWGTWWVWDARLTSELILLFLYLGIIAILNSFEDQQKAEQMAGILAIVGVVNVPIIHYSVYWWNTLHQGDTLKLFGNSLIAPSMLYPLLAMIAAFMCYTVIVIMLLCRAEILTREAKAQWVKELI